MRARKVSNPSDFLFLKTVHKTKIWSIHDLAALKPFCSSTSKLLDSKYFWSLWVKILEYILATQHIIVMQRFCNGSRGSLSFFGMGLISFLSQSVGFNPLLKQRLKNLSSKSFAFSFLRASLGISRYALLYLELLIHLETSLYKISELISHVS